MKNPCNPLLITALSAALCCNGGVALAGTTDVVSNDGQQVGFEYRGEDRLRVSMPGQNSYLLLRDDKAYAVTDANGHPMVVDINQAMAMFGDMAQSATPAALDGELLSLEAAGRTETIAGIEGEVYMARYLDHNKTEQSTELVLAGDPRVLEFQQALFGMAISMGKASGQKSSTAEDIQGRLAAMNKGILRYGEEMRVTAISDRAIDESRFVLPAPPTDLSAIQGMLGGGQGNAAATDALNNALKKLGGK